MGAKRVREEARGPVHHLLEMQAQIVRRLPDRQVPGLRHGSIGCGGLRPHTATNAHMIQ